MWLAKKVSIDILLRFVMKIPNWQLTTFILGDTSRVKIKLPVFLNLGWTELLNNNGHYPEATD